MGSVCSSAGPKPSKYRVLQSEIRNYGKTFAKNSERSFILSPQLTFTEITQSFYNRLYELQNEKLDFQNTFKLKEMPKDLLQLYNKSILSSDYGNQLTNDIIQIILQFLFSNYFYNTSVINVSIQHLRNNKLICNFIRVINCDNLWKRDWRQLVAMFENRWHQFRGILLLCDISLYYTPEFRQFLEIDCQTKDHFPSDSIVNIVVLNTKKFESKLTKFPLENYFPEYKKISDKNDSKIALEFVIDTIKTKTEFNTIYGKNYSILFCLEDINSKHFKDVMNSIMDSVVRRTLKLS